MVSSKDNYKTGAYVEEAYISEEKIERDAPLVLRYLEKTNRMDFAEMLLGQFAS